MTDDERALYEKLLADSESTVRAEHRAATAYLALCIVLAIFGILLVVALLWEVTL